MLFRSLIPEIPYDIKKVCKALEKRTKAGKGFSILAVAEGAISKDVADLPKKERKAAMAEIAAKHPSVAYHVAEQIKAYSGLEIRVTVPGICFALFIFGTLTWYCNACW